MQWNPTPKTADQRLAAGEYRSALRGVVDAAIDPADRDRYILTDAGGAQAFDELLKALGEAAKRMASG